MILRRTSARRRRGMTLLEVMLALGVFSVAALALVKVMRLMGTMTLESRTIREVEQSLETLMDEYSKAPILKELDQQLQADNRSVRYHVRVIPVEDLRNQEGRVLGGMFRIIASATWPEGGRTMEMSSQTLRYAGAFVPTGGSPIPINQPMTPLAPGPGPSP
ncbi:MAG: prepilin-type N-terminal cleavage/methylation domain-containing protein [Verrucomicrobiales bacterium]|nr:prepilin-type N-terminal cleavage/methylation domain-containing protein [Verrucomicrobiales bacterium]